MLRVEVIDPRLCPAWDEFVASHPQSTVFHTTAWARVLCETYRYAPRYYVLTDSSGNIVAGIPLMLVSSRLTGKRLVGLPFSDFCPPLVYGGDDSSLLLSAIRQEIDGGHLRYVELRGPLPLNLETCSFAVTSHFLRHLVPLDKPPDELKAQFHSSARRAINKAEREGVSTRLTTSQEDVQRFYQLHTTTRRMHGLVPQPWAFFERIHAHFLSQGGGFLLLAEWQGDVIAGDLLLLHSDQLLYKFNASDRRSLELRPNNVLLWQAIQLGKQLNCRIFDFGRCETTNEGLRRFKTLWASQEVLMPYCYYPAEQGFASIDEGSLKYRLMATTVRLTPGRLLPPLGALLYRHLG